MLSSMGGLSPNAEAEAAPCGAHAASSKAGQSTQAAANVVRFMDESISASSADALPAEDEMCIRDRPWSVRDSKSSGYHP